MSNTNSMTQADIQAKLAELEKLKQEVAAMRKQVGKPLSFKVSEKGAVSVYGLQRFPITLYSNQWERLLKPEQAQAILEFIKQEQEKGSISKGEAA
jgi:hypothetical protein